MRKRGGCDLATGTSWRWWWEAEEGGDGGHDRGWRGRRELRRGQRRWCEWAEEMRRGKGAVATTGGEDGGGGRTMRVG
ncbi:unnamed protein product [Linum trigynum]|uniref:Uncharacterized protein n=1 Tax=Linum trigynum TaxID=586398 RepID=A0AAV2D4Y7_9ROSI